MNLLACHSGFRVGELVDGTANEKETKIKLEKRKDESTLINFLCFHVNS